MLSFAEKVINSLKDIGHEITIEDLYKNQFDPVLSVEERETYYRASYDSSKVSGEIERLVNADALVMIFPTWWFSFPAILKGCVHLYRTYPIEFKGCYICNYNKSMEAISKRPLGLNIGVGARWPILKMHNVCLRLTTSPRLDLEPD